jgi:hypothetical protein
MNNKKQNKNNEESKCKNTLCNIKKFDKIYEEAKLVFQKVLKNFEKKLLKKKDITLEEKKSSDKFTKSIKKIIKQYENPNNKKKKINIMKNNCEISYCNKGCIGTIFEKGNSNKLSKELIKKYDGNKVILNPLLERRKQIFKKKKNVLKDNFYKELKNSNVKKIIKKGAISGCTSVINSKI